MMPQPDKSTYSTQFFRLCLIFLTFHISPCRDGVPRISRIPKPRNQLVPHQQRGKPRNDPNSLEEISGRGFSTGVSHMYSSLFEVSHSNKWCDADLQGRKKITYISRFGVGERSGSRRIERNVSYLIPKSSYHTCSSLSEVRLCYFIELPSSMMDYADLCFFLKDIIQ
nr:ATPase subunit 8 [Pinus strobus]